MSNIDKHPYHADGGDIGTGRIREIADNPYGDEEKCWLAKRVLALQAELEATYSRIGELEVIATDYGMKFQRAQDALKHQSLLHKTQMESAEKRIADYQELISGLVGVSSSILREVERINNTASAAGKGEAS
ncbi:hypothetical protein [Enterobacter hormaechei]|uniref:hypothetical protein n=1 Tax=Enterobacter hormaechei TaxID=158836 RepID=UPI00307683CE